MFGREHSRKNRIMRSLDARNIHKTGGTANERAAGKDEFWHRLPAAFGDGPCAKRNPLAAGKQGRDHGMRLEALKFVKWRQRRIPIVQVNHETNGDESVFEMIEERAAAGAIVERPAEGMLDEARPVQRGIDPPKLLQADAEFLRLAIVGEAELRDQLLGERTPRAFGDQSIFATKLDAPCKSALEASVAGDSHVSRSDAQNLPRLAIKDLGAREAGKDIDAQGLRFRPQKAHAIAERADVIAMIIHEARQDEIGQPERPRGAEHVEPVGGHFRLQRPISILAPSGEEFIETERIDDRAGQNMGAESGAFFDDNDRHLR